ncbi:MAG TPA: 23S rRNA (uridine(2552)-2'-O)-methyltransferase RlmE [Candidatus Thiothrix moscowensis]|uniref:23S rRNA (uridine(2552)-2'-O)-methyltransferase RlmE n=1 Tax=unclassified Thiothrix TaxID=2636184 RepID=UPI0025CCF500|nr:MULTISPECIES: 23S rRNA (uridine(2552)-2'-O)-methyltransferase RlmE [unclassified Thiothrix]HRJ53345.1 23S rRNA (uridine(2552)-2'-O)-methyltransferase RlmE [Candidatus Thiothrix moscowensis]HRJ94184.1 23S rRNA (uridine(2552)-2'-O)-methyltransferase RlmE [Candidatus Thiothrix moscowensis]
MARSKSSNRWLGEHFSDEYVKKAQQEGYRSRAVYKLKEIQEKDHILRPAMKVVDLGAAPGGWSQYATQILGKKGRMVASDILPIDPLPFVEFVLGDFREDAILAEILHLLGDDKADLVISDMAPNMSGVDAVDQPRAIHLCELALDMARQVLKPGGTFLVKLFQGDGSEAFLRDVRSSFKVVKVRKPAASRPRSREVYVLAQGFVL